MIVPMKKITVVVQAKDLDPTLRALQKVGVLHIEHQNAPINDSVTMLRERLSSLSKAIEVLPGPKARETLPRSRKRAIDPSRDRKDRLEDPEALVHTILGLMDEREVRTENLKKVKKDIDLWQEWGDFDPGLIEDLEGRKIWIRLCKINKKEMRNIPAGVIVEEVLKKGSLIYCIVISREEMDLPFETQALPEKSLGEMLLDQEKEEKRIKEIEDKLNEFVVFKDLLSSHKRELSLLIEYSEVAAGIGSFKRLSYLRGYSPSYNVDLLERLSEKERWGLIIEDPDENDNVPTLIKNPRWIEIIRPMFQIIKTIPGYREVDTSLWFFLFFSIFFGMLIGDAGYGAIFFIITLLCHLGFRSPSHNKEESEARIDHAIFFLTYVLSLCAIVWGVLTGTFFGQSWLTQRVEPLLPYLRDNANVQALCFFIGAIHLSIAHIWRFIRKMPSLRALSEAGWILMLWTAYLLARMLILGQDFPEIGRWLLIAGSALIILFTNPQKNVFKSIGSGVGDFLLRIVNSFTDVVSYIRLFAVGAATVAVADAFNQMASTIGYSNVFAGILTALVLLFGHTLNILLGAMAILVHGVRLNVLEFSSHLNMEWTGVEYAPFKREGEQDGYKSIASV